MKNSKDSYDLFMQAFPQINENSLWQFASKNIIMISRGEARKEWENLKDNILTGKNKVYIRGYGRDAAGTEKVLDFYKNVFSGIQIFKDRTNNERPTRMIERLTGHYKSKKLDKGQTRVCNFQVSHVFGRTKNPFLFTAPWNVVFIPKVLDPFTGHEAKGKIKDNFKAKFEEFIYNEYKDLIEDYNSIINVPETKKNIEKFLGNLDTERAKDDIKKNLSVVQVEQAVMSKAS